jgi:hypothetical protein
VSSLTIGLISAACIVIATLLGFLLQKVLPNHHLSAESKDTIKLSAALLATMTALVLGLLISSAKSSFDATSAAIVQAGAKMIMFDRILANYGPETNEVRAHLRNSISTMIDRIWGGGKGQAGGLQALEAGTEVQAMQSRLRELKPQNSEQQLLLTQAAQLSSDLAQSRWVLIEQMQNRLPRPLLVVLVLWISILFLSFALFAPRNGTVLMALLVGALSVSSAIFLVLELNRPLDGSIKVSDAPLRKVLEFIGK